MSSRSATLGRSRGMRDPTVHRQTRPVLHGDVSHIAELRLPPGSLPIKPAVGIGHAGMGVVLALLSVEVRAIVSIAGPILRPEALVRSPGLDQPPVHRKMLVRKQRLHRFTWGWFKSFAMNLANTS